MSLSLSSFTHHHLIVINTIFFLELYQDHQQYINMKGLILLLYSIEILGALLCGAHDLRNTTETSTLSTTASVTSKTRNLMSTGSRAAISQLSSSGTTLTDRPCTTTPSNIFYRKDCLPALMVSGGLIIFCAILLLSTFLLAWKVCQLSRRIKELSGNADLICYSEPLTGTAKANKSNSETDAKETSMLMTDVVQTQDEVGNGTTKEEGGMVNKDGQIGEENKEEEEANNEEASTTPETVAENSSSSKPQEEAQATKAVAAPSSQGMEEPKDVV